MDQINQALAPLHQHDACDDCGKRTDGLMTCTYPIDDSTTKLCPDCIKDSGFCLGCGQFSAGISSFDFSDMPGYCENCRDEIKSDFGEFDDDFDDFEFPPYGYDPFDDDVDNDPNDSRNL